MEIVRACTDSGGGGFPLFPVARVVSMSDAVRYLALRADSLGGLADMNLRELGFVSSPSSPAAAAAAAKALVTVSPTIPAVEAFALMCHRGVVPPRTHVTLSS